MSKKNIERSILAEQGYLTVEEFTEKLSRGLKEYLESNWPGSDDLHHPEDLFASASIYVEIGRRIVGEFKNI